jgi:hypothetical protein
MKIAAREVAVFFDVFADHLLPNLEALKTEISIARTLRELRSATLVSEAPQANASDSGASGNG